jgi:adenosylcobinamide-GDP ribazoletransferase
MPPANTLLADMKACIAFYTRFPVDAGDPAGRSFAQAQWAAPIAGLAVALCGSVAFWLADALALPPFPAALAAIAATMLASGALHEDGLSDTFDGFGGGRTRERKLEIMRDSRIGSYGAAALIFSILLRAGALAAMAAPGPVTLALIASHMSARALMPFFMQVVPPARSDGLSAGVGVIARDTALTALLLGGAALLPMGLGAAVTTAILLALWTFFLKRLTERQIGGQTGDVLGTLEQGAEILVLLAAASLLQP